MISWERLSTAIKTKTAGFWGFVLTACLLAYKGVSMVSNVDFIRDNWSAIGAFIDGWGMFIGLVIAGLLIAKAIKDTPESAAPPPKTVKLQSEPVAASKREMSSYEAEMKIRVIDDLLAMLRGDPWRYVKVGKELQEEAWGAFKHAERFPQHESNWQFYEADLRNLLKKLEAMKADNRHYIDIVSLVNLDATRDLLSAVGNFHKTFVVLRNSLREDAKGAFHHLMGPRTVLIDTGLDALLRWRNSTQQALTKMRQSLSPN